MGNPGQNPSKFVRNTLRQFEPYMTQRLYAYRVLLGRIAGLDEARIMDLIASGKVDEIITAVKSHSQHTHGRPVALAVLAGKCGRHGTCRDQV